MDETEEEADAAAKRESTNYYKDDDPQQKSQAHKTKHSKSEINEKMYQKQFIRENSPVRDIPYNILEESISMIERTALRLLPIMKELGNKLAGTTGNKGSTAFHNNVPIESTELRGSVTEKSQMLDSHKKSLDQNLVHKKSMNDKGLVLADDIAEEEDEKKDGEKKKAGDSEQVDMRTILGFLNQNEWILNLNIGNIM